jgi:hypothetical protein
LAVGYHRTQVAGDATTLRGYNIGRSQMTTIAKALLRVFIPTIGTLDDESLAKIILFCAAGLLISLILLTNGLDLGSEFVYF